MMLSHLNLPKGTFMATILIELNDTATAKIDAYVDATLLVPETPDQRTWYNKYLKLHGEQAAQKYLQKAQNKRPERVTRRSLTTQLVLLGLEQYEVTQKKKRGTVSPLTIVS
jgi:hypothetical protein